jgi:hypothetical protein
MHTPQIPSKKHLYETVNTANGKIEVDGHRYDITFARADGKKVAHYLHDYREHPLRSKIAVYLLKAAGDVTASTINQRCLTLNRLGEFMALANVRELTPEVFRGFCHWLLEAQAPNGSRRFADVTLSPSVNHVRALYRSGLQSKSSGWNQRDLDLMSDIAVKVLRGCRERGAQKSVDNALSHDTYSSLMKAIAGELEQCRRVLNEFRAGERTSLYNLSEGRRGWLNPNPFVVLALIGATQHGLRAEEVNAIKVTDLRDGGAGRHELYLHAANKKDDFMPVNEAFVEVWRLCEEWNKEGRVLVGTDADGLLEESLLVCPPGLEDNRRPLIHINSYSLNTSHLPSFFQKWFSRQMLDKEGRSRPVLHAEGDTSRPLKVSYKKLRNAFAIRFAEREQSRAVMMSVMRHANPYTSERFYLHQTRLDHAKKVQIALSSEAHALALRLKNPVGAGVSEETLRLAAEAGAMTPHGLCGSALEQKGCERASNCLECPMLVLVVSRKPRLQADRDAYLEMAENLQKQGDVRGAENALSRAKLCQAHLLKLEDRVGRGGMDNGGK